MPSTAATIVVGALAVAVLGRETKGELAVHCGAPASCRNAIIYGSQEANFIDR